MPAPMTSAVSPMGDRGDGDGVKGDGDGFEHGGFVRTEDCREGGGRCERERRRYSANAPARR